VVTTLVFMEVNILMKKEVQAIKKAPQLY